MRHRFNERLVEPFPIKGAFTFQERSKCLLNERTVACFEITIGAQHCSFAPPNQTVIGIQSNEIPCKATPMRRRRSDDVGCNSGEFHRWFSMGLILLEERHFAHVTVRSIFGRMAN